MDRIPAARITLFVYLLSVSAAHAQPVHVLGTGGDPSVYQLYTPQEVVTAGGGGSGGVPTPPANPGDDAFMLTYDGDQGVAWIDWLSFLFPDETNDEDEGKFLTVNDTDSSPAYIYESPSDAVISGLPTLVNGKCLKASATALTWDECGGGGAELADSKPKNVASTITPEAGTGTKASRDDHVHGIAYSNLHLPVKAGTAAAGSAFDPSRRDHVHPTEYPSLTGQAGKVLTVNSGATGIEWAAGGSGGGGGEFLVLEEIVFSNIRFKSPSDATCEKIGTNDLIGIYDKGNGDSATFIVSTQNETYFPSSASGNSTDTDTIWRYTKGNTGCQIYLDDARDTTIVIAKYAGGSGGGGDTPFSDDTPRFIDGNAGAPGIGTQASRDDHRHRLAFTTTSQLPRKAGTALKGVMKSPSRFDHIHPMELPAQSAQNATRVLSRTTQADGIFWDIPSDVVSRGLPAVTGHAGNVLTVNAAATGYEWATTSGGGSDEPLFGLVGTRSGTWNAAQSITFTASICEEISEGDFIAFQLRSGTAAKYASVPMRIGPTGDSYGMVADDYGINRDGEPVRFSWSTSSCSITIPYAATGASSQISVYKLNASGGGGGSGPSIPTPTSAGKLKHLRVNAAGAAYELADPPVPLVLSDILPSSVLQTKTHGVSTEASRADHIHTNSFSSNKPASVAVESNTGTDWHPARRDHVHGVVPVVSVFATQVLSIWTRSGGYTFTETGIGKVYAALFDEQVKTVHVRVTQFQVDEDADSTIIVSGCVLPLGTGSPLSGSAVVRMDCPAGNPQDNYAIILKFGGGDEGDTNVSVQLENYNSGGVSKITVSVQVIY